MLVNVWHLGLYVYLPPGRLRKGKVWDLFSIMGLVDGPERGSEYTLRDAVN
jgi:hypothetical protein